MMNSNCGNELRKPKTRLYNHLSNLGVFQYPVEGIRDGSPISRKNLEVRRGFSPFYIDPTTQELVFVGGVPLTFEDYINEDLRNTIATDYSMNFSEDTKIVSFIYPKYERPYVEFNEEVLEKLERFGYAYLTPIVPPQEEDREAVEPDDFTQDSTPDLSLEKQPTTTEEIKPGVEELFESNPELANQMYEALGFDSKYITPQQKKLAQLLYSTWINYLTSEGKLAGTKATQILYHGTDQIFDTFDKTKRGTSTGEGYFKDEDQTPLDSMNAFFFSTDYQVSAQYGLMRRINQISGLTSVLGYGLVNQEKWKNIRKYSPELADHLNEKRKEFNDNEKLKAYIKNLYLQYSKVNDQLGVGFLNQYNNYYNLGKHLEVLKNKKQDILSGNYTHNSFSAEYPTLPIAFYEKPYSSTQVDNTGKINSETIKKFNNRNITDLSSEEFDELIQLGETSFKERMAEMQDLMKKAKLTPKVYTVLLNIQKPLEKDFEGKTFVDQAYESGAKYEASKLTNQAAKSQDKYDGVIFKNIKDPYLSDNYGVFEPEQVYMLFTSEDFQGFKEFVKTKLLPQRTTEDITNEKREQYFRDFYSNNQNISRDDAEDYFNQCMI